MADEKIQDLENQIQYIQNNPDRFSGPKGEIALLRQEIKKL